MLFAKLKTCTKRAGYTLVEVLVVVVILGILSTMGVAGLQRAVANARIKDAAVNTSAFMERMGNEAIRMSADLCLVAQTNSQKIRVYKIDDPSKGCHGTLIDSLVIDYPNKFVSVAQCGMLHGVLNMLFSVGTDAPNPPDMFFHPKPGLSAVPVQGAACIQYGDDQLFGAATKLKAFNSVKPQWKIGNDVTAGGADWMDL